MPGSSGMTEGREPRSGAYSPEAFGFGDLFWRVPEAIIVGDAEAGRIVLWNPAAEAIFGYTAAEIGELLLEDLVAPEIRDRHIQGVRRYLATGRGDVLEAGRSIEVEALSRDGSRRSIELTLTRVTTPPVPGNFILAMVRDVSERAEERRRREALLHAAQRLSRQSNPAEAMNALLEEAVVLVGGHAGVLARWAPESDELRVVSANPTGPLGVEVEATMRAALRRPATGHRVVVEPRRRGRQRDLRASSFVLAVPLARDGDVIGVLAVDVRPRSDAALAADAASLEILASLGAGSIIALERSRLRGALLAASTAAHEMNNRLTLTVGYSEMMANDAALPERLRRQAERAARGAIEAAEVLDDLQSLTRIEETPWLPDVPTIINLERSRA